jgi:hypothetical protein
LFPFYLKPKIRILNTSSNIPRFNGLFTAYLTTLSDAQNIRTLRRTEGRSLNNEMKRRPRKQSLPISKYYADIYLETLRNTTKHFRHDSRSPGRHLNLGRPVYEAGAALTQF